MHVDIKLVYFTNKPHFAVQIVSFLMNIPKAANVKKKRHVWKQHEGASGLRKINYLVQTRLKGEF